MKPCILQCGNRVDSNLADVCGDCAEAFMIRMGQLPPKNDD